MIIASALGFVTFALSMCSGNGPTPPIACNLKAIDAEWRPRYHELMSRLRRAIRDVHDLPNGYVLDLDATTISLVEAAEWMDMERLCCPFLVLELGASGTRGCWTLRVAGPEEAKTLIRDEFLAKPEQR